MTASGSVNAAVEAMRCGASDYLTKPFAMDSYPRSSTAPRPRSPPIRPPASCANGSALARPGAMIGRSGRWKSSIASFPKSPSPRTRADPGESARQGAGGQDIHAYGPTPRAFLPSIAARCADADRERAFGYVKAPHRAIAPRRVIGFGEANGLLDEIGELSLDLQPSCQALQEKEVRRLRIHRCHQAHRAATNRDWP